MAPSSKMADSLDVDELMRQLDQQVSHYEQEKLACRLKVCFILQLVRSCPIVVEQEDLPHSLTPLMHHANSSPRSQLASGWFCIAASHPSVLKFGTLCALTSLCGFYTVQSGRRALLVLVRQSSRTRRTRRNALTRMCTWISYVQQIALTVVVVADSAFMLTRWYQMTLDIDVTRQRSTHQLLDCFMVLGGGIVLLQVRAVAPHGVIDT